MYATLRHSTTYWVPVKEGGEGGFDTYSQFDNSYNKNGEATINDKINWWKVGGCDIVGALIGSRGGAVGAILTGAGASTISIIMQA